MRILVTLIFVTINIFIYQTGNHYKNEVIELKEELSIGMADGAEEYIFNRPVDINVDSKGNIYIADQGDKWIKVFDPSGKYLKTIGREGLGPGEFEIIQNIFIDDNDFLYATDRRLKRISKFNNEGEFEKSFPYPAPEKLIGDFHITGKGNFILNERERILVDKKGKYRASINIYDNNMEFIKTLFSADEKVAFRINCAQDGRTVRVNTPCFLPYYAWSALLTKERILTGDFNTSLFRIHSLENREIGSFKVELNPKTKKKENEDDYKELVLLDPVLKNWNKDIKEADSYLEERPLLRRIIVDDTGYILITDLRTYAKKGREISLFDFEGNFIKKVYFKKFPRSFKIKKGKFYGIVYTEEGWAKAVRYKINQ